MQNWKGRKQIIIQTFNGLGMFAFIKIIHTNKSLGILSKRAENAAKMKTCVVNNGLWNFLINHRRTTAPSFCCSKLIASWSYSLSMLHEKALPKKKGHTSMKSLGSKNFYSAIQAWQLITAWSLFFLSAFSKILLTNSVLGQLIEKRYSCPMYSKIFNPYINF